MAIVLGKLVSLCDMITYQVFGLAGLWALLSQEERIMTVRVNELELKKMLGDMVNISSATFTGDDRARVTPLLNFAERECQRLELDAGLDRIGRFRQLLRVEPVSFQDALAEARALREAIEDGIKYRYFYYYPRDKAERLLKVDADWGRVDAAFPATKTDSRAAVDCYAIGHYTACVYHSMIVLERGLEALARALKVRYKFATWQTILTDVEKAIASKSAARVRRTKARDGLLTFYAEAAKEFTYFKDAWRNHTAHGRTNYIEQDADKVLTHVQGFMAHISTRLKGR